MLLFTSFAMPDIILNTYSRCWWTGPTLMIDVYTGAVLLAGAKSIK